MSVTLPIGFDFCSSTSYVSHTSPNVALPDSFRYGVDNADYGWHPGVSVVGLDRDSAVSNKSLASITYVGPGQEFYFRVNVPAGSCDIRLAIGDAGGSQVAQHQYIELYDDTTLRATIDKSTGPNTAQFYDATGVLRTSVSDWTTNNAAATISVASGILQVRVGNSSLSSYTVISHLDIAASGGGGGTAPTISAILPTHGVVDPDVDTVFEACTLTGTHFDVALSGGDASVTFSGSGVTAENKTITSASVITFDIEIVAGSATGSRTVTVTTDDGSATTSFSVNSPGGGSGSSVFTSSVFGE